MNDLGHWSDCAVHNEPAYPAGPCNCGELDPAAYDRYVRIVGNIPTARSLAAFIAQGEPPGFIEPEQAPNSIPAGLRTAHLKRAHNRISSGRSADSVDFDNSGMPIVTDDEALPGAQSLTGNMPPHRYFPDSKEGENSTPGDRA